MLLLLNGAGLAAVVGVAVAWLSRATSPGAWPALSFGVKARAAVHAMATVVSVPERVIGHAYLHARAGTRQGLSSDASALAQKSPSCPRMKSVFSSKTQCPQSSMTPPSA